MPSNPISLHAITYVRGQATAVMHTTCRIERVDRPDNYDETTLVLIPGSRITLYEGLCRVWELTGAALLQIGESDLYQQATQLSIPWDTTAVIKRYDEVEILADSLDPQLVGKRFEIQNVAKAGDMRATRRFEVLSVMEK